MNFCSNCGTKQNLNAKFCANCGLAKNDSVVSSAQIQSPAKINISSTQENLAPTGELKKELVKLSNSVFTCFVPIILLMSKQAEGGFAFIASEAGDEKTFFFVALMAVFFSLIGATYFAVRVQGVNKGKPGWLLGTLIVWAILTVISWTMSNFSNYNWADWVVEIIGLAQLFLIYATYQLLNASKTE